MTQRGFGETLAAIRAEAQNPRAGIWFGGSEIQPTAAAQNLLRPYTSPNMAQLHSWAQRKAQMPGTHQSAAWLREEQHRH